MEEAQTKEEVKEPDVGNQLNPKDFINFKIDLDLLNDDRVDVFRRWSILECILKTRVYENTSMFLDAGGVEVLCALAVSDSALTDQQIYLEHEEEVPFVKQPIGEVPPLGSLRRGAVAVLAELTKIEVYRQRIDSLNVLYQLCEIFTTRMGYLIKFGPDRAELQTELPKDQTLLLLERLLSCVSYLAVGSVERASTIIRLLGKELLLICTVVNNTPLCDNIVRLLDNALISLPDPEVVYELIDTDPFDKLHAIRSKCSMPKGRNSFDRFMFNLDTYCNRPIPEVIPPRKYDKLMTCGSCGVKKEKLAKCSVCSRERYCNVTCQKEHWLTHQLICKKGVK